MNYCLFNSIDKINIFSPDITSWMNYKIMLDSWSPPNTYIGGRLDSGSYGAITVVMRYNSTGSIQYVVENQYPPILKSFTLSLDGTYLCYILEDGSNLNIFIRSAIDFAFQFQIRSSSLTWTNPHWRLIYDSSQAIIYFSATVNTNEAAIGYME